MRVLSEDGISHYERGSVMITSNLPFSKWDRIFKDQMTTAAALIDRVGFQTLGNMKTDTLYCCLETFKISLRLKLNDTST